jgi:PAS domain S-box-containing protein
MTRRDDVGAARGGVAPTPLANLCGSPMETGRFLDLAISITSALEELHSQGIIHKNLTPQHILVHPESGVAEVSDPSSEPTVTDERATVTTPRRPVQALAYVSPEQTGRLNQVVDSRADLYSLGVVFYEMLTGSLPFQAHDALEWVHCHVARLPRSPSEVAATIPPPISEIVLRLLSKTAEGRFQTASGLKFDLERCLEHWHATGRIEPFPLGEGDFSDRLLIPQTLYGREKDVETLQLAFSRVVERGTPEMAMVAGYSGIGKTSLVRELHRPIVRERGLFISGKFDQYKRNIPYSTIVDAFRELVQQILTESEERVAEWRRELRAALGINGQLIVDIIPQVELIIGKQSPVPDLPLSEAEHRFRFVFQRFVGAFTTREHPLVLFLDDLQWVDSASLKLLEHIITDEDTRYLLLIGAYRDNEVGTSHSLMLTLDNIRNHEVPTRTIILSPLSSGDVSHLLADALRCDPARLEPLTQLVYEKTAGNPFFLTQFLLTLHVERLLEFDRTERLWKWDIDRIQAKAYTDNVVDLMARKLINLPAASQRALRLAACVGNRFDLDTLSAISNTSPQETRTAVQPALSEGLVVRVTDRILAFLHDRVQQAAYSLIPLEQRPAVHLEIGRLLLARTPAGAIPERVFDIANQFKLGGGICDPDERHRVAELDLLAGKKAKASTAYSAALGYLELGTQLLDDQAWDTHYELSFALHKELAEVEYLSSSYARSKELIDLLLHKARSRVERAELYNMLIVQFTLMAKYSEAISAGREAVRSLGIVLPETDFREALERELARHRQILGDRPISSLVHEPELSDPEKRVALELLSNMVVPSRYTDMLLFALISILNVNFSLMYGPTAKSTVGYSAYGMVLNSMMNRYRDAYEFGQLALKISERFNDLAQKCQACFMLGHYLNHWVKHLKSSDDFLDVGHRDGLASGEMQWTGYALAYKLFQPFYRGAPIRGIQDELPHLLAFTQKTKNQWGTDTLLGLRLALSGLCRRNPEGASGASGVGDPLGLREDAEYLAACSEHRSFGALGRYLVLKAQVLYLVDRPEEALGALLAAQELLGFFSSSISVSEHNFYHSLVLAALHERVSGHDQAEYLGRMRANQNQMKTWADNCEDNFKHQWLLVEAELARLTGRELEGERLYEQAIGCARGSGFTQDEGLANELASRFHRRRGFETIADAYLRQARACYVRWGADVKVTQLDALHPWLQEEERAFLGAGLGPQIGQLDAIAVVKASQAISGEVVVSDLVETLMRTVIEIAGAQKGCLILAQGDDLSIEAEATVQGPHVTVVRPAPPQAASAPPVSIVNYVRRTHETVILDDATRQNRFPFDEYLTRSGPLSVLCLPLLRQANLIGMLYLENGLVRSAFTTDRIGVLKLLAAQAAISLESAALYLERSRAEAALRKSEATYRALFENSGTALMFIEEDMTISMCNKEFEKLCGFQKGEVEGRKKWTEFVAKEDELQRMKEYHRLRRLDPQGAPRTYEFEFVAREGKSKVVVITMAMIPGWKQSLGALLDVTERRKAEEALRESESRYRTLVNNVNIGVYRNTAGSGRFIQANPAMVKMFGYDSTEDFLRIQVVDLYRNPEDRKSFLEELGRNGFVKDMELALKKKDGTPIWCSATVTAQYDDKGQIRWTDGVIEDITERRKLEEQLRQAQKMDAIGTLAGGIAHDFNNILTAVTGYGTLVRMQLRENDPLRNDVDEILSSTKRAANLTRSLLAFSRKQVISPQPVDLNDIVVHIGKLLRRLIGEDIELRTTLANERLPILADRGQMEQVVMNLAANARDAMPQGGLLVIKTEHVEVGPKLTGTYDFIKPGRYAVISVSDTGKGMDEKTRLRIFEPFFTTKEVGKGTGLGLSIVYGIIKQHDGQITVYTEPGKGTTFKIFLNLITGEVDRAPNGAPSFPAGGTETILVAEDDPSVRRLTRNVLEKFGYTVIEAVDGEDAVRKFRENTNAIQLVVLDVVMPRMNGKQVYDEITRIRPGIRVLFSSGYTAEIINQKGALEEGIQLISKPVDPRTLLSKVREVLSR